MCAPVVSMLIGGGGCASWYGLQRDINPTSYQGQGDEGIDEIDLATLQDRPLLMIGALDNPRQSVVRWRDVGKGVSEALSKRLQNRGELQPWVSPRLGREIAQLMEGSATRRFTRMEAIRQENPDLAYILFGKVTDFQHVPVAPRPDDVSGEPAFLALMAIEFSVVDVQSMRIVMTDHVSGEIDAGSISGRNEYRQMSFDSYQFLSTPLGRASQQAIDRVVQRLVKLPVPMIASAQMEEPIEAQLITPAFLEENPAPVHVEVAKSEPVEIPAPRRMVDLSAMIRIDRQIELRKVTILPGRSAPLHVGQVLYVGWFDPQLGRLVAVEDLDTGLPLRAKILKASRKSGVAMLTGLKPIEIDLRRAVLSPHRVLPAPMVRAGHLAREVVAGVTGSP